jgi:predicted nucleic acid-binding protein
LSSFVLDASMTLGWILDRPVPPRANQVRQRLRLTVALVPSLWHYEVTNVVVMARRTRRITDAEFASLLEDIEAWKNFVSVEPVGGPTAC